MKTFPFSFWQNPALPDPTSFAGFTAMYRQPDYVLSPNGLWVPRSTTISSPVSANLIPELNAHSPTASNGEPTYFGADNNNCGLPVSRDSRYAVPLNKGQKFERRA